MSRFPRFTDDPARGALLAWWTHLCEHDTAGRAQLRRCASPTQVVFVPAFHRLLEKLKAAELHVEVDRLAAVAGLAAGVKTHTRGDMALQLAGGEGKGDPAVSPLRVRRLLDSDRSAEIYTLLRRFVDQLGGACDLPSLARAAYDWAHLPGLRRDWALTYYANAPAPKESTR